MPFQSPCDRKAKRSWRQQFHRFQEAEEIPRIPSLRDLAIRNPEEAHPVHRRRLACRLRHLRGLKAAEDPVARRRFL